MRFIRLAVPFAVALAFAAPAGAQERWYGGPMLAVDAGAIGLGLAAGAIRSDAVGWVAIGAYSLGGPLMHLMQQRPGTALASYAVRVTLPALGAGLGALVDLSRPNSRCGDGNCPGIFVGAAAGALGAMLIDDLKLAVDDRAPRVSLAPIAGGGRAGLLLSARF